MTDEINGLCRDHSFESAEDLCRRCGLEFCELCLVYPFGAAKPLCKECAMSAGGVRTHTQRPAMGKRQLSRKVKAFRNRDRNGSTASPADPISSDAVLTDPLAPTVDDLARVPASADAANSAPSAPDPPPRPAAAPEPAEGVAPPIDWNQPFG